MAAFARSLALRRGKALTVAVGGLAGTPKSVLKVSLVLGCDDRLHQPGMLRRQSPPATWSHAPGRGRSSALRSRQVGLSLVSWFE